MTKTTFAITFLTITLMMTPATFQSAYATELVTNGSFELPNIAPVSFGFFAAIPGWTATSGNIEIQDNVAGAPAAGNGDQFVELDSFANSGMEQTLTTVAGEEYLLTFDYSPRPGQLPNSNGIEVFWDGNSLGVITADGTITGGITDWNTHQFFVMATGASTDLEFVAVGISNTLGGYIDVVSVTDRDMICEDEFGAGWEAHDFDLTEDTQSDDFIYVLKCIDSIDPCLDDQQGVELKDDEKTTCSGFGAIMFSNVATSTMKDALNAEWEVDIVNNVNFFFGDNCTAEKKGKKQQGATVFECDGADLGNGLFGAAVQVTDIMTVESPSKGKRNSCDGAPAFKPTSFVLFANEGVQGTVLTPLGEIRQIDDTPGIPDDFEFSDFVAMTTALQVEVVDNETPCPI